jgi:hypothetical protein
VRVARFKVWGRFDGAPSATITIMSDGTTGLVSVRPYRRRRDYTLTLGDVAQVVIGRVVRAEAREKLAEKRRGRGRRS